MKIFSVETIEDSNLINFQIRLNKYIKKLQNMEYEIDIKFSTVAFRNYTCKYIALIIIKDPYKGEINDH